MYFQDKISGNIIWIIPLVLEKNHKMIHGVKGGKNIETRGFAHEV